VKKVLIPVFLILVFLIAFRAVVLPLAQQREERAQSFRTALALLPEETLHFQYQRYRTPPFPGDCPIPRSAKFSKTLAEAGISATASLEELLLKTRRREEWILADSQSGSFLIGPERFLPSLIFEPMREIRVLGSDFLASADSIPVDGDWLSALPEWSEVEDLLLAADLLHYSKETAGTTLLGIYRVGSSLLLEAYVWQWQSGSLPDLLELYPWTDSADRVEALPSLPYLRRTAPWGPDGFPLKSKESRYRETGEGIRAMSLWVGEGYAALFGLLMPPGN
jgi:hypothetical protein